MSTVGHPAGVLKASPASGPANMDGATDHAGE
eukprot:CAMPEP_0168483444 /NCGR_PEP_ID=MMETSP0228-20121227/65574_1 /TAXON_ID=133427 /ORGANISM="Protoceratium reticulatum, Strain CCCM 535 (=CCMP 1889)" /LENGTH=31 /DNA_ID= /DNA_START= /DNA_END= /DNA_ORIENTATION=